MKRIFFVVFLLLSFGCQSVPTSSEGAANDKGATGKGGTFACQEGYTSQVLPDGTAIPGSCAKGLVWTDPPSAEESTLLEGTVNALMRPFEILAEALARLVPGN